MTDASTPAIWRRLIERTIDLLRTLATADDANEHVNYCWWCQNDINGKDGPQTPHAADCPWVAARTLETDLDFALRAYASEFALKGAAEYPNKADTKATEPSDEATPSTQSVPDLRELQQAADFLRTEGFGGWANDVESAIRRLETALRACADPPDESGEEQALNAILQSVLQMFGLPFNAAWFDEHGDWDFGKLREHGLDARLAETRAALRACADALDAPPTPGPSST